MATVLTRGGRLDPVVLARLLVGCALDDGQSEELSPIEGADPVAGTLTLAGGQKVLLRRVMGGAIVDSRPGHPLLEALAAAETPAEQREALVRSELRRRRVEPDTIGSAAEREVVLGFLTQLEGTELPSAAVLHAFYEAMKPAASPAKHRRAVEALQALMTACVRHGDIPPSLPWRLAWFLNQAGRFDEVVALSEAPEARASQGMDRAILATIRASALLSLARMRHDTSLLDQAEAALKVAYGIDRGSDEVRAVYRELNRQREQVRSR